MDMSGMGMGMNGVSSFYTTNSGLARTYWYLIAGVLGFAFIIRTIDFIQTRIRLRIARSRSVLNPSKPQNFLMQVYATATAICREISSPELRFTNRWISWLSPPPLGRSLILATYWAVIVYMLRWESVVYDAYYWERIGYRAAWVSVTQVPLVYLLAARSSIIGYLSGSSYERLNWLHRWVSRTLLLTVTIHGGHFFAEWVRAGNVGLESFVVFEINMMPMVKYGMGAWFVLLWTFLSSLTPIRRLSYEIFVLQHLAAAGVFLWLLYVHVPSYAVYNIWFAIAAVSFDKISLFCWSSWENVKLRSKIGNKETKHKMLGHHAQLRTIDDDTSEVIIENVKFNWRPGQHVYLRVPVVGLMESHPFTIANGCKRNSTPSGNDIQLVIQAQSGFTRRLHRKAKSASGNRSLGLTAIVTGPFGNPPAWNSFETLVLISASTGASFTLPIMESILLNKDNTCTSRIDVLIIVRRRSGVKAYLPRLREAIVNSKSVGVVLDITIAITGESDSQLAALDSHENLGSEAQLASCQCGVQVVSFRPSSSDSSDSSSIMDDDKRGSDNGFITNEKETKPCCCGTSKDAITYTCGRPDIASFIRKPVETSGGETSVAVCGGNSLVAMVRNDVVRLSDERAVHKGTGAQGIHLHAEHYCF